MVAVCAAIIAFSARRGVDAAMLMTGLVGLSMLAGLATVIPKSVIHIDLNPKELVLRYPFGRTSRLPLSALMSGRVVYAALGNAAPDGGRTRMVQLDIEGADRLTVTDAEFTDVDAWIDALQQILGDQFHDERE